MSVVGAYESGDAHLHMGVWVEGEIEESDLRPIVEALVQRLVDRIMVDPCQDVIALDTEGKPRTLEMLALGLAVMVVETVAVTDRDVHEVPEYGWILVVPFHNTYYVVVRNNG